MQARILQLLMLWLGLGVAVSAAHAADLTRIRAFSDSDGTRVVLDLSGPVTHRRFSLSNPDRIVVDLPNTANVAAAVPAAAGGVLRAVRTGQQPGATTRVVLDVAAGVRAESFLLAPEAQNGYRVVIDLRQGNAAAAPSRRPVEIRAPRPAVAGGRDIIIAIDAGHGGHDPGASGGGGVREKDVVLEIAQRLAAVLAAEPGFEPRLVRASDQYLRLQERTAIARRAEADFFISIHADAYRNASAQGATVYVLSEKGASDEAGRRLAERENDADLIGGVSLAEHESAIASVILDITQTAAISASIAAADHLIGALGEVTRLRKRTVQQAGFRVLKSPDIPSVLIETAYLSNPAEAAQLRTAAYQERLAQALGAGIVAYFFENPPPGSLLALNPDLRPRQPLQHAVVRGETLSGIAERYRISVARIMQTNSLTSEQIRIGQILTIPRG